MRENVRPIYQYIKTFIQVPTFAIMCFFILGASAIVHALDSISSDITYQVASGTGSNNSKISISTGGLMTSYMNQNNDSTIAGNYFSGYYYDTVNGFYKFNWDTSNPTQNNVHIEGLTDACGNGVIGYKLAGYAKGDAGGYINFAYNNSIFVYYCTNDSMLRGYAYNANEGFQNFSGITFNIQASTTNTSITQNTTNDQNFVNNFSRIIDPYAVTNDAEKISVFYIIK